MIKAKTVIPDQYWILRDQDRKIGNIEARDQGYTISINGKKTYFTSMDILQQQVPVSFDVSTVMHEDPWQVYGYPTTLQAHNSMFDVKRQLPLWTDKAHSRSWLAAGWYRIQQHRSWRVVQCPKLIILDRYSYSGPFHTRSEAQTA